MQRGTKENPSCPPPAPQIFLPVPSQPPQNPVTPPVCPPPLHLHVLEAQGGLGVPPQRRPQFPEPPQNLGVPRELPREGSDPIPGGKGGTQGGPHKSEGSPGVSGGPEGRVGGPGGFWGHSPDQVGDFEAQGGTLGRAPRLLHRAGGGEVKEPERGFREGSLGFGGAWGGGPRSLGVSREGLRGILKVKGSAASRPPLPGSGVLGANRRIFGGPGGGFGGSEGSREVLGCRGGVTGVSPRI